MRTSACLGLALVCIGTAVTALRAAAPWPDSASISGPKVIAGAPSAPTDAMRRPKAFILHLDPATRVAKLRLQDDGTLVDVVVLPHAEFPRHASTGEIGDYAPLDHVIVRLHEDRRGEWRLATYLKDDLSHQHGHGQTWRVDAIERSSGRIDYTVLGKGGERETGFFYIDHATRFWRKAQLAEFGGLRVGDGLRVKTRGVAEADLDRSGADPARGFATQIATDVMLDDASLEEVFRRPQSELHARREREKGLASYVDEIAGRRLKVTVFRSFADTAGSLPIGTKLQVVPAEWDLQPEGAAVTATLVEVVPQRKEPGFVLDVDEMRPGFLIGRTARIRIRDQVAATPNMSKD